MLFEIILLTGLGLTGKLYGVPENHVDGDKVWVESEMNGRRLKLWYKDTGKTKYTNGKQRRIFELVRIEPWTT